MDKVALIGAGLIGQAWAIVFARAGQPVVMWDPDRATLDAARPQIGQRLDDLVRFGLIEEPAPVLERVSLAGSLEEALAGAAYVQESAPERVEVKQALYRDLDRIAAPETILASSTSGIPASAFTEELAGRQRCLVAHPINPPYLIPLVELCPAPWTEPAVVDRTHELMSAVGQSPVRLRREVAGFVANRMQAALLGAALRMVDEDVISGEDLDVAIRDGLGLRWSFMGPFETIDLNAPGGIRDYLGRYGPLYQSIEREFTALEWTAPPLLDKIEGERRQKMDLGRLPERSAWRDRRLMALVAHRRAMKNELGD